MSADAVQRLIDIMDGLAALHAYPYPGRHAQWQARLQHNAAELSLLAAHFPAGDGHYLPARIDLPADGIAPPQDTGGIAAQARQAHDDRGAAEETAQAARDRASRDLHNAFIQVATQDALQRQLDAAWHSADAGAPTPLLGVPIAVKDLMAVRGFRQTWGSGRVLDPDCDHDALAVARLRAAGAVIVGTCNLHELAYGITSENPHYGTVGNPRRAGVIAGGSSGGSAAAVAAGVVRATVGTDTGGSIRIPAACCGVVGFKPSYSAVPRDGAMVLGASLDHLGPIAQSVDDAALLFSVMTGQPPQVPRRLNDLSTLRIGLPRSYFYEPLTDDVRRAVDQALQQLRADGATLQPVDLPDMEYSAAAQFATLFCEATAVHWEQLVQAPETLGEDVRVRLEIGQFIPGIWYTRAQGLRARLAAGLAAALANVDVLLTPTLRSTAPPIGAATVDVGGTRMPMHAAMTSLTQPFNLTGLPALTLPCGTGNNGLPVSLQVIGAAGADWQVLAAARRMEAVFVTPAPPHTARGA